MMVVKTVVIVLLTSYIATSAFSVCDSALFLIVSSPFDAKNPFLAPVTVNRKLNKAGDRHLMHLELDITGSKIR